MSSCFVVLRHYPNIDNPDNEVTTVVGLASTIFLAEKLVMRELGSSDLICILTPEYTDVREYYRVREFIKERTEGTKAASCSIAEHEINDDLASV